MTLGDIVKNYREANDLSMSDFGKLCDLSRSYISLLEKNINPKTNKAIVPTLETLVKVSKAMRMDLNELIMNYKEKYKDYQILLGKITEVVFEGFASTSTVDKIIRAK